MTSTPNIVASTQWTSSDTTASGSIAVTNGTVLIPLNSKGTVSVSVTGTWSGSLQIQGAVDYANVGNLEASATWGATTVIALTSGAIAVAITANGIYQINTVGFSALRVFGTNIASGTANIVMIGSAAVSNAMADNTVQAIITSAYPQNATPITGNATGSTSAVVGTLAAVSTKTTYICGFNVQAIGGTATCGPITIAGLVGSSQVYQTDVNSATVGKTIASAVFNPPIPASAVNTPITITTTANGTASAVDVNAWGFQL